MLLGIVQFKVIPVVETLVTERLVTGLGTRGDTKSLNHSIVVDLPLNFSVVIVLLTEIISSYEYTMMVYVLIGDRFVNTISSSLVDNTFLVRPPVLIYSITY